MAGHSVAILIPAYNEEKTIRDVIKKSAKFGDVFVLDDWSTDQTNALAKATSATVIRPSQKLGYSKAISQLIDVAFEKKYHYAVTLDADGEHDARHIGEILELLEKNKVALVVGIRRKKQRFSEHIFCLVGKYLFGPEDLLCGMKGYCLEYEIPKRGNVGSDIGTNAAINSILTRKNFLELQISGNPRIGRPRFGGAVIANLKILFACWFLLRLFLNEVGQSTMRKTSAVNVLSWPIKFIRNSFCKRDH